MLDGFPSGHTQAPRPGASHAAASTQAAATIDAVDKSLGHVTGSADHTFLQIGSVLGDAVTVFGKLSGKLTDLAEHLHGARATRAITNLEQVMLGTNQLARGENQASPLLARLDQLTGEADKQLQVLQRILNEVAALAINGKIQAVRVADRGLDFSVFTSEVDRLGRMAREATERAAARLQTVSTCIASARAAAASFEKNEARELESVRQRVNESLSQLASRREMAANAAKSVASHSQQISRRIATTVAELQINDNVCQRLEHIRTAVRAVAEPAAGRPPANGAPWLERTPSDHWPELAGAAMLLMVRQLHDGSGAYHGEVNGLISNLHALASDAATIQAQAETAFSCRDGSLFMQDIARDVGRAGSLLRAYTDARQRTQAVVDQVTSGFQAMAADLATIRSIDTDMRIMGLNATLKCGRLGADGRALGVVAHELRAYSKRTEECSRTLSDMLAQVRELSSTLNTVSETERAIEKAIPLEVMSDSVTALESLGDTLSQTLAALQADTAAVSRNLGDTAKGITIHHQVSSAALDAAERLQATGVALAPTVQASMNNGGATLDPTIKHDLDRLTMPLYTMERERNVHRVFFGGTAMEERRPPPSPTPVTDTEADESDIDDLFF